jgi:hypothetical protein
MEPDLAMPWLVPAHSEVHIATSEPREARHFPITWRLGEAASPNVAVHVLLDYSTER